MNVAWNIARCNFTDDDGSLPGVEFNNLKPTSVCNLVKHFFQNATLTSIGATLWHNQLQADLLIANAVDPASLVVSGIATPFHCCFQLHAAEVNIIPVLGLSVYQDAIEIDYRMGISWNPENVEAFFRLLIHLKTLAPEAIIEPAATEGPPFPVEFMKVLNWYSDTRVV